MDKKRDDFSWIVTAWEDLTANRNVKSSYRRRPLNEVEYESWKKHKKRDHFTMIIYVVLFALSIIIPLLLH